MKLIFVLLLGLFIILFNAFPTIANPGNNYPVFAWQDNTIYLNIISQHDNILNANPYLINQDHFLFIWPFFIINKMSIFLPLGFAYLLFITIVLLFVIKNSFELGERLKINPFLFSTGFLLLNSMLYPFVKIIGFVLPQFNGFQWTGIEWLKGTNFLLNLWHPIFLTEILFTLFLLNWLMDKKDNEGKIGLSSLLVYFSRGYVFPIYWFFSFASYYVKTKKINRFSILTGLIVFSHYLFVNQFPGYKEMIAVYSLAQHYPTFWVVSSSFLLLFLFIEGIVKVRKIHWYLIIGLFSSVVAIIFTPLNIRTTLVYTLFLNIGAGIGFATLRTHYSKIFFIILSLIVLYFSISYTFLELENMVYINPWGVN